MAEEIAPVLTPDEWERKHWGWASWEFVEIRRRPDATRETSPLVVAAHPHGDGPPGNACITTPPQLAATIALANDALPDDSEYKITRADVQELLAIGAALDSPEVTMSEEGWYVQRLAAKLAALLPPE